MIIKYIFINIAYIWRAIAPKCSVVIAFRGCKTNFVDEDVKEEKKPALTAKLYIEQISSVSMSTLWRYTAEGNSRAVIYACYI